MLDNCYGSMDKGTAEKVVVDEGNNIGTKHDVSLDECKKMCNQEKNCQSFAHCPGYFSTCYLKDKILAGHETTKSVPGCTTYYQKKCESNYK